MQTLIFKIFLLFSLYFNIHSSEGSNSGVQNGSGHAYYRWSSHTALYNLQPESCSQQAADILQNTCISCSSMSWTFQRLTLTSPEAWCILYLLCITLGLLPAKFWNRQRESNELKRGSSLVKVILLIFSKLARLETEHSAIFKPPTITFQEINSE